jgi:four helix bundle protein
LKWEFRAKIGIVEQEAGESLYWLEILKESGIAKGELLEELLAEADELVAIFTAIGKKSKN